MRTLRALGLESDSQMAFAGLQQLLGPLLGELPSAVKDHDPRIIEVRSGPAGYVQRSVDSCLANVLVRQRGDETLLGSPSGADPKTRQQ